MRFPRIDSLKTWTLLAACLVVISGAAVAHAAFGANQLEFLISPSTEAETGVPFKRQPLVVATAGRGFLTFRSISRVGLGAYLDSACSIPAEGVVNGSVNSFLAYLGIGLFDGVRYSGSSNFHLGVGGSGFQPACSRLISVASEQPQEEPQSETISLSIQAPTVGTAGACSGAFVVSIRNSDGNETEAPADVAVSLGSMGSAELFDDENCANAVSSLAVAAGARSRAFYLKDMRSEELSLIASAAGVEPSSPVPYAVNPGPASLLSFVTQPPATGRAGMPFETRPALRLTDAFGNPAAEAGLSVGVGAFVDAQCAISAWGDFSFEPAKITDASAQVGGVVYGAGGTIYLKATIDGGISACSEATRVVAPDSMALGSAHTCALKDGGVRCWGLNLQGNLGNGTKVDSAAPVQVVGLESGVISIAAGGSHTCALVDGAEGGLWCWGSNGSGELGDGTLTDSPIPMRSFGPDAGVQSVVAGESHTCVLLREGVVECWGYNDRGQLGTGDFAFRPQPARVRGLTGRVREIYSGPFTTCALLEDRTAACWGYNAYGQVGNGETIDTTVAAPVQGLEGVRSLAPGYEHGCALLDTGVRCWGRGATGQLGNGSFANSLTPVAVLGSDGVAVASLASGMNHACMIDTLGVMRCWGNNARGQLGDGRVSGPRSAVPVPVLGFEAGAREVSIGYLHSCGNIGNELRCWGWGRSGQLGNGVFLESFVPVTVLGY